MALDPKHQPLIIGLFLGGFVLPIVALIFERDHLDKLLMESRVWWGFALGGLAVIVVVTRVLLRRMADKDLPIAFALFGWFALSIAGPSAVAFANRSPAAEAAAPCASHRVVAGRKAWRSGTSNGKNVSYEITLDMDGANRTFFVDSGVWLGLGVGSQVEVCVAEGRLGLAYASKISHSLFRVP